MRKKMVAPIIIGVLVALYMIVWLSLFLWADIPAFVQWAALIPVLIISALLFLWVHVVMERIQEIRSGEEDDLSKY